MAWTYLQPRTSHVVASPTPTGTTFTVTAATGKNFVAGFATLAGNECNINHVATDLVTLTGPLPANYVPVAGDELVQTVLGDKDKVRLYCGDTDQDDPQVTDEEISVFLALKPNILRAAALACIAIAGNLSRKVRYQIYQEIQEDLTAQAKAYREQACSLRAEAARTTTMPFSGGLLQISRDIAIQDTRLIKPFFTREQMQEPGTEPAVDEAGGPTFQPFF